jgi:hypothetical protein
MSEPPPSVPVVRLPSRRIVAGVVLLAAGLLAIGGTFGSLFDLSMSFSFGLTSVGHTFTTTSWTTEYPTLGVPFGTASRSNYFGLPAVVASALALYGADALLRGRGRPLNLVRVRLFAVAACALLAGFIWFAATNLLDSISVNADADGFGYTTGAGMWILIAACLVAALGSVLLLGLKPEGSPAPAAPADEVIVYQVDVDTPPMGFEVPVDLPPTDTYNPPEKP